MSGIFGIFNLDNLPVATESLLQMSGFLTHRGPEGIHTWQQDFVGLGHCMLHTTPESLHEVLPYIEREARLAITADARIDNREELSEQLGITKSFAKQMSDSQFILAAYAKWGVDCCMRLLGDFSFAIWDEPQKRLFCVRDAIGIKPFYYHKTQRTFFFCSEIRPLVRIQPFFPKINEGMVGELLAMELASRQETLFDEVFRLPPAHFLMVENGTINIQSYWDLSFRTTLYYKDSNEYAEHFLEIFQKSVARRLRSHLPVSAELSGGLDSSSIVATAASLNHPPNSEELRPFALIFPGLPCDEQDYIRSVAQKWALNVNYVSASQFQPPDWQNQVLRSFHYPDMPNLSMCDTLVQRVQTCSRVILSGIGGDQWFTGYDFNVFDLAAHRRWQQMYREILFQGKFNYKTYLKKAGRVLLWPALPAFLKNSVRRKSIRSILPDWLPDSFIRRTNLTDRIAGVDARLHLNSLIDASCYQYILSDIEGFFLETLDRHRAFFGVENRYPFLDKDLIEFSASLPEYQKRYCGKTKYILRQGLSELLPEKVKDRHDKAEFSYFFGQTFLHPAFESNMNELTIAANGWIDKEKFLATYKDTQEFFRKQPTTPCNKIWPIWFAFATELWYKSLYK